MCFEGGPECSVNDPNALEMDLNFLTVDITNLRLQSDKMRDSQMGLREIWGQVSAFLFVTSVALGKSHFSKLQYFDLCNEDVLSLGALLIGLAMMYIKNQSVCQHLDDCSYGKILLLLV